MKKKLIALLTIVCVICCALSLVACAKNGVALRDIKLDVTQLTLAEGETAMLTATITPSDATDLNVKWSSSNQSVAVVENGYVVAIRDGEATITAELSNGKKATCKLTITDNPNGDDTMQFTVTFDGNGGKFPSGNDYSIEWNINWGDRIPPAPTPLNDDKYEFKGWYIKGQPHLDAWNFASDRVFNDMTLYARWEYQNDYGAIELTLQLIIADNYKKNGKENVEVDILSIYNDDDGYLCFIEKDRYGVTTYKTQADGLDASILDDSDKELAFVKSLLDAGFESFTEIDSYAYYYNSDKDPYIADNLPPKYPVVDPNVDTYEHPENKIVCSVIYACVSDWVYDNDVSHNTTTNGPWYSCKIKALMIDEDGKVFTYSATIVSATTNFNYVLGEGPFGGYLSKDYDQVINYLGDIADGYYSEYLLEKEASILY